MAAKLVVARHIPNTDDIVRHLMCLRTEAMPDQEDRFARTVHETVNMKGCTVFKLILTDEDLDFLLSVWRNATVLRLPMTKNSFSTSSPFQTTSTHALASASALTASRTNTQRENNVG